jgi:hypothetical protein
MIPFANPGFVSASQVGAGFWNPAYKSAKVSLRGSNTVAYSNNAADDGDTHRVRSLVGHAAGKYHAEIAVISASAACGVSLATGDEGVDSGGSGLANGVWWLPNGSVWINSGDGGAADLLLAVGALPWATGDRLVFEADLTNWRLFLKRVRGGVATDWNNSASANPATGAGALSLARIPNAPNPPNSQTLYPMPILVLAPDQFVSFLDGGFLVPATAGYSNWG